MNNKPFYFILFVSLFAFFSCNLDAVDKKQSKGLNDWLDTATVSQDETPEIDNKNMVLSDTLEDGQANEMVWNADDGLRIEWTKKESKNPVLKGDVIMVNYEERVARGEVFDSNKEIGEPVPLKTGIGQLIKGWETALLEMHIGDVARIMIPSPLAYGKTGVLGTVPQNADIIVEIEIVSKITPIELEDGVKVYKYETVNEGVTAVKNQLITFNYFAFRKGSKAGLYDNSYQKNKPYQMRFQNDNLIDGLHIGMQVMKSGEKAYIDIPSNVAYGSKGLVDLVPSNTDIVFDVRIESIE